MTTEPTATAVAPQASTAVAVDETTAIRARLESLDTENLCAMLEDFAKAKALSTIVHDIVLERMRAGGQKSMPWPGDVVIERRTERSYAVDDAELVKLFTVEVNGMKLADDPAFKKALYYETVPETTVLKKDKTKLNSLVKTWGAAVKNILERAYQPREREYLFVGVKKEQS